jgi:hypothetical protein
MSARKHDYTALEREYITTDISIRALCKKHDIKGYSSVAQYAREHEWEEKRERIMGRKADKMVERVSDQLAEAELSLVEEVRGEWLTVIRAATYRFAEQLKDPEFKIRVPELIALIDKGLVLIGEPSSRTEERHLALTGTLEQLPEEFVRRLAEGTRSDRPVGHGAGLPTRVGPEATRPN